jgi:hypothetical protein
MLLGHQTDTSISNLYKILKSGYLKSGKEVGKRRLIGNDLNEPLSEYIFLTLLIPGYLQVLPHFELNTNLLLDNVSYLSTGWNAKPTKVSVKINGSVINNKQLTKILNTYLKYMKDYYYNHEILVENKIDLKKYLKTIRIDNCMKKYKTCTKILNLLKKEYPDVKIVSVSQMRNKYK